MTPATAPRPAPAQPLPHRRPQLRVLAGRGPSAPRAPFVLLLVGLLTGGLVGLLLLNTAIARDSFVLEQLRQDNAALVLHEQALRQQADSAAAPQTLAARARALGMVPAGPPAFIRLPDGAVLGSPTPAPSPSPTASPAAGR